MATSFTQFIRSLASPVISRGRKFLDIASQIFGRTRSKRRAAGDPDISRMSLQDHINYLESLPEPARNQFLEDLDGEFDMFEDVSKGYKNAFYRALGLTPPRMPGQQGAARAKANDLDAYIERRLGKKAFARLTPEGLAALKEKFYADYLRHQGESIQTRPISLFADELKRRWQSYKGRVAQIFAPADAGLFSSPPAPAATSVNSRIPQMERALDAGIEARKKTVEKYMLDLQMERLDIETFRELMRDAIRRSQVAAAILGAGGVGNLSQNHFTILDREVNEQFRYLDGFIRDLGALNNEGKQITAKHVRRARLYIDASRVTARESQRQFLYNEIGPEIEERRRLTPADHCADCEEYEAEGWQPIGTLPPIGDSQCGMNCRCYFEYRFGGDSKRPENRQVPLADETEDSREADEVRQAEASEDVGREIGGEDLPDAPDLLHEAAPPLADTEINDEAAVADEVALEEDAKIEDLFEEASNVFGSDDDYELSGSIITPEQAGEILGITGLSLAMIGSMVGAPKGSKLSIARGASHGDPTSAGINVSVFGDEIGNLKREIFVREGGLVIYNNQIQKKEGVAPGFAQRSLDMQVQAAKAAGVSRIEAFATGYKGGVYNGYYTLPRMGYDGKIPRQALAKLPEEYKDATTIQELFALPGGQEWWKDHGSSFRAYLDLSS